MQKSKTIILLIVLGLLVQGQARALFYSEIVNPGRVLGEQTYAPVTVYKSSSLTLTVTPFDYDSTAGLWNYKISWNKAGSKKGSVYINGSQFAPQAYGQYERYTGYSLKSAKRYLLTFYAQPAGKGGRIFSRYFTTLAAPASNQSTQYNFGTSTDTSLLNSSTPPVIFYFAAAPPSISAGQSTTLSWQPVGATSVRIDNGIGDVTGKISVAVSPSQTTTYTLTATNSAGSV